MGEQELSAIDGMPPDIINPPQGCPFYDRCSLAMCICEREEPPSFDFGQGHKAKCWPLSSDGQLYWRNRRKGGQ